VSENSSLEKLLRSKFSPYKPTFIFPKEIPSQEVLLVLFFQEKNRKNQTNSNSLLQLISRQGEGAGEADDKESDTEAKIESGNAVYAPRGIGFPHIGINEHRENRTEGKTDNQEKGRCTVLLDYF
jgi:hypothetical protein